MLVQMLQSRFVFWMAKKALSIEQGIQTRETVDR